MAKNMRIWVGFILVATARAEAPVSYFRQIRPIVQRNCQGCHQPAVKQGNLDLTTYEGLKKGGNKGPGAALVVAYLEGKAQPRMPMGLDPLPAGEIDLFRKWIAGGARDDTPPEARETVAAGKPPVYRHPPVITALAWSADGKTLAVSGYREVLLHHADGSGLVARLGGLSDRIQALVFSADGATLVAAGGTPARFGEVQVWEAASGRLARSVTVSADTVFGASLAPDGSRVAVGCTDNTVRVIETASGKELHKIGHHENWVLGTAFGIDGRRLVSVGRDRAAKLTDAASGAFIENVNLLREELSAVARHPRRDWVLIGGQDGVPYLYRMDRPKAMKIADDTTLVRQFERQLGPITALAFNRDGSRIAVGGGGPEAPIYNTDNGERAATCRGHQAGIYAVAFRPDGVELATGGFDGRVRIYEAASGKLVREFVPAPLEKQLVSQK
jgi:WD40 repeat protein